MEKGLVKMVTGDSPCKGDGWCFLRDELMTYVGMAPRQIVQMRLMVDYRYVTSKKLGYNLAEIPHATSNGWVNEKYAERFEEAWKKTQSYEEIKIMLGLI
jgi:hypothetical protein